MDFRQGNMGCAKLKRRHIRWLQGFYCATHLCQWFSDGIFWMQPTDLIGGPARTRTVDQGIMSGQGFTRSYIYQQVAPLAKAEIYLNLLHLCLSSCWLWYKSVTPQHKSQGPWICVNTLPTGQKKDPKAEAMGLGGADALGRAKSRPVPAPAAHHHGFGNSHCRTGPARQQQSHRPAWTPFHRGNCPGCPSR